MERHYWGNVDYPTNAAAKRERDAQARAWRREGYRVTCGRLTIQLRPYGGLGQPDGRTGHVYIVRREDQS